MGSKDERVLGLFLAAVLAFTPGCSSHTHIDRDRNGYCDECNAAMSSTTARSYYGNSGVSNTSSSSPETSANHISTASSPKGGIGSHSAGSGG